MNATDHNPYGNATQFSSVRNGIFYHAERYMSWGYTDAINDFRYFGSHVGNKGSGMNVKYASDPYWGEKIAGHYYRMDKALGSKDYNYYQLAIKQSDERLSVGLDSTIEQILYVTENGKGDLSIINYPVLVLESSDDGIKVQSDIAINLKNQEAVINASYDFKDSTGYLKLDDFYFLNETQIQNPDEITTYVELEIDEVIPIESMLQNLDINQDLLEISDDSIMHLEAGSLVASEKGLTKVMIKEQDHVIAVFDVRISLPLQKVSIESSTHKMKVGETMQLQAKITPTHASNQQVMWISSDSSIATVDQLGDIQALSEGEVTISLLSDEGGLRDDLIIKIKAK